jgi:hypothetical protein
VKVTLSYNGGGKETVEVYEDSHLILTVLEKFGSADHWTSRKGERSIRLSDLASIKVADVSDPDQAYVPSPVKEIVSTSTSWFAGDKLPPQPDEVTIRLAAADNGSGAQ